MGDPVARGLSHLTVGGMNENPPTVRLPDLQTRFDRVRRGEPLDDTIGRGRALLALPPEKSDEAGPFAQSVPVAASEAPRHCTEPMAARGRLRVT